MLCCARVITTPSKFLEQMKLRTNQAQMDAQTQNWADKNTLICNSTDFDWLVSLIIKNSWYFMKKNRGIECIYKQMC